MAESLLEKTRREAEKEYEDSITEDKKHLWYNQPDALHHVKALSSSAPNKAINLSPLSTTFAIHAGKLINLAFVTTAIVAAPASIAWGTGMTITCMALGLGLVIRKRLQQGIPLMKQINRAEPAPPAVKALLDNTIARAQIDRSGVKLSILTETFNAKSKAEKTFPYGAFIHPSRKHFFIGQKALETLDLYEMQTVLAHETGHLINRPTLGRGDSITENSIGAGLMLMGLASLATLNFLSAGYYISACVASKIGRLYLVRLDEYRADRSAVYLPDKPEKGPQALKKMYTEMLQAVHGSQWQKKSKELERLSFLHSHPTLERRERYVSQLIQQIS